MFTNATILSVEQFTTNVDPRYTTLVNDLHIYLKYV